MPEGPEIRRAADKIAQAIAHQPMKAVFFAFAQLKPYEADLARYQVEAVETYGKAMLIRFSNQLNIYSHNQLYGKWFVRPAHSYPETNRQLRLALHTAKKSALLYSASDIEVLHNKEISAHPFIQRIGLDVLRPEATPAAVLARVQTQPFYRRQFKSLLLDQQFLAGIGNYLRSEILYVAGIHPTQRPLECTPEQLQKFATAAIALPYQSYRYHGITNDLDLANQLKAAGYARKDYRHWVFGRQGKPCFQCDRQIIKDSAGGRRYYYCPSCQGSQAE
ncbi:endonuclease VIII [Almyronema epifaneia]|uniref:DNA-(apurinic or apyrimidinic site) lyase n=1 Tax=Almyronema epifaneia S1 TaxID=2991925 RepID=A0ABW6IH88_9CYAN